MTIIKVTTLTESWPLIRQTPNGSGIWRNVQFYINDASVSECDYWVVIEGLKQSETVMCPPENTIFITWEPSAIRNYNRKFINQFSTVVTSHKLLHANVINTQQSLQWMIGAKCIDGVWQDFKDYDFFRNSLPKKEKTISIIVSNKQYCEGHKQRIKFLNIIKEKFNDKIDIYGSGFNHLPDKYDAIYPYKYHIVLENSSEENYWSEKLSDAFIGWSYPIYYGCPNIYDYFEKKSLSLIDIYNSSEAIDIIQNIIDSNYYEKNIYKIEEARDMVLDVYNIFPFLEDIVRGETNSDSINMQIKCNITLNNENSFNINTLKRKVKSLLKKYIT